MSDCFVIMPFGGYFDAYYTEVIKPAVAQTGLKPIRADEVYGTGSLVEDIYRRIINSRICIADVTGRNPNVSYELGMAHALNKPVVIITQDISDVPFDYKHLRIVTYDPMAFGWEGSFSRTIVNTISAVLTAPDANLALKPLKTPFDVLRSHLVNVFFDVECELERIDDLHYGPEGHTRIETEWRFRTDSSIFHLCYNLVIGKPGNIELTACRDVLSGRDLEVVELERGEKHLSAMILLKQFKKPGQSFVVRTTAYAEFYIFGLELDGSVSMSHQAAQRSGIHFSKKIERYHFPRNPIFSNVHGIYLSHPTPAMVGQVVRANDTGAEYLLEIEYRSAKPYRQETGAKIAL
jgi:hypothetical protein